jgi:hypothetical protein
VSDPLLLPLALAAIACYDDAIKPTWSAESHVYLTEANAIPGIPDGALIFSYEGTATDHDWFVNFCAVPWSVRNHPETGPVHLGWYDSVQSTFQHLVDYLSARNWPQFLITGHSKGAAEAGLSALLFLLSGHAPAAVRLYEPPKFASQIATRKLAALDLAWTQTVNCQGPDGITQLPAFEPWTHPNNRVGLIVPDKLDFVDKHKMPAVLAAIQSQYTTASSVASPLSLL